MIVSIVCDKRHKFVYLACICYPKTLINPALAKGGEKETWLWNARG
jgi:hypothetical protein